MVVHSIENYRRKPIKITKDIVNYIVANKNSLIDKGVVKRVDNFCQCVVCGKESDIYLTVKGDGSTSVCLNCAVDITLDQSIEINCALAGDSANHASSEEVGTKDAFERMKCF